MRCMHYAVMLILLGVLKFYVRIPKLMFIHHQFVNIVSTNLLQLFIYPNRICILSPKNTVVLLLAESLNFLYLYSD